MDAHTRTRRGTLDARVRDTPSIDPSVALLIAIVAVLLALAVGTGLFLLLPATL